MRVVQGAVMAAVLMSSAAAGEASKSWTASGKWEVEFADQQCFAIRNYMAGERKVQVVFEAVPTGEGASLYLIVPAEELNSFKEAPVMIGSHVTEAGSLGEVSIGGPSRAAVFTYIKGEELAALEAGGILGVGREGRLLQTGLSSLGTVRKLLKECTTDLLVHWGYSRAAQDATATGPVPTWKPIQLFAPADYPSGAIRRNASGRVRALVEVGADGLPKTCRVVMSSRDPDLDSKTCSILSKNGRYTPAKDATGRPVSAPLVSTITWVLPS